MKLNFMFLSPVTHLETTEKSIHINVYDTLVINNWNLISLVNTIFIDYFSFSLHFRYFYIDFQLFIRKYQIILVWNLEFYQNLWLWIRLCIINWKLSNISMFQIVSPSLSTFGAYILRKSVKFSHGFSL